MIGHSLRLVWGPKKLWPSERNANGELNDVARFWCVDSGSTMDQAQSSNDYRRVLLGLPYIDSWPISRWIRPSYEEMNGYRRWVRRAEAVGELALGGPDWDVTVALMNEIDEEPYSSIVKLASLKRISECLGTREAGEISKAFARSPNHPSTEFLKDPKIVDWAISLFHCVSQVFRLRDSSDNMWPQEVEEWVTDAEQYLQFLLTLSPSDDHSGPTAGPPRVVGADSFLEYKNVLLGLPYVNSWPIPEGTFEAIEGEYYDKWVRSSETLGELPLAGPSWDVVAVSMVEIDEPFASVVKLAALKKLSQCGNERSWSNHLEFCMFLEP